MNNRLSSQERVAEAFLSGLLVQGIEYVFSNGGTDFAPIVEALAEANNTGRNVPRFINVPMKTSQCRWQMDITVLRAHRPL